MTDIQEKMLAFIETRDGESMDEWYATDRDFASTVLTDFAKYIGVELVVPDYVPQLKKPEIDRNALLKAMMPKILEIFNMEHAKHTKEQA
jgi:hypothetical protein